MPRPKQRTPELRDRLLHAALRTLADEGVSGFTTRRVADGAATSVPAVYELFGDKAGLVRAVFFEGFRRLGEVLGAVPTSDDPAADLKASVQAYRHFVAEHPALATVMFSRPFTDFDPGPDEAAAGGGVRRRVVGLVERCVEAGLLTGDPTDLGHVVLAMVQGLAAQEAAGWLGTTEASIERRWDVGLTTLLRP
jgi:AcrR family transcriptional regulator